MRCHNIEERDKLTISPLSLSLSLSPTFSFSHSTPSPPSFLSVFFCRVFGGGNVAGGMCSTKTYGVKRVNNRMRYYGKKESCVCLCERVCVRLINVVAGASVVVEE